MRYQNISGLLLVDKPLHLSSNQLLQKVKRLFNAKKAGHTGSLDPLATGMLPICFGDATKFSQFMLNADKGYTATGVLGKTTTTQDSEGEVVEQKSAEHIGEETLKQALKHFLGESMQVPSMYSALKKDGVPLYKLARQGIEVERKARAICIEQLELLSFDNPYFTIRVRCSKGTYIRNLVEDIGNHLGVGAYVEKLHRDYCSPFDDQTSVSLQTLQQIAQPNDLLMPIATMVSQYSALNLTKEQVNALYYGQIIEIDGQRLNEGSLYQLYDADLLFIGLGLASSDSELKVKRLVSRS